MSKKSKRARRTFTDEYKAEAVQLVRTAGKSVGQVAKDLDLTETALREWVKKAEGPSPRRDGPLDEGERVELKQLREENRVLRMERDFLKKAAAFFARETK
jgi:transposase